MPIASLPSTSVCLPLGTATHGRRGGAAVQGIVTFHLPSPVSNPSTQYLPKTQPHDELEVSWQLTL